MTIVSSIYDMLKTTVMLKRSAFIVPGTINLYNREAHRPEFQDAVFFTCTPYCVPEYQWRKWTEEATTEELVLVIE